MRALHQIGMMIVILLWTKFIKIVTRLRFKKTPVIPAVSVCLARKFNEAVAMDLMDFREMVVIFLFDWHVHSSYQSRMDQIQRSRNRKRKNIFNVDWRWVRNSHKFLAVITATSLQINISFQRGQFKYRYYKYSRWMFMTEWVMWAESCRCW